MTSKARLAVISSLAVATAVVLGAFAPIERARLEPSVRLDALFTLTVETPHVAWGKPSPGPPIHALVVPTVSTGRTLVELAERMNLTYDAVTIDEAWDVNTWTIGTDRNYEARNYKLAYQYLTEYLTSGRHYDVIVLPSIHGWNRLPSEARKAILRRVRDGAGLVLVHPTTGIPAPDDPKVHGPLNNFIDSYAVPGGRELWDVSPLIDVLSDRLDSGGDRVIRPDAITGGAWTSVAPPDAPGGFITRNIPFATFPTDVFRHYKYKLGNDSTALVTGPNGEPIVATKSYGRGRVVALGYVNDGISPRIDFKDIQADRGFHAPASDYWWEYAYSFVARSIIWAAKREPSIRLGPMSASEAAGSLERGVRGRPRTFKLRARIEATSARTVRLTGTMTDEWGHQEGSFARTLVLKRGSNVVTIPLADPRAAGLHTVDVILEAGGKHYDWGTATLNVPASDAIASIATDREVYTRGDKLTASVSTTSSGADGVVVELWDNRGRLIGRGAAASGSARHADAAGASVTLTVGNYTTNIGWVQATLYARGGRKLDEKRVRVNFAALDRKFGAYEMILPWHGPPSYEPWTPTLDDQLRKIGVTVTESPERNFRLIDGLSAPGFGVYWHRREAYLKQKDEYLATHDTKYLIREPDLASDAWLAHLRDVIRSTMQERESFRPLAYYLADESSLTAYEDPLDFSWSPATLAKLRDWLKTQYPSLDALNREWDTQFLSWESVLPLTTEEAQRKGNYAGWMDHRTFMEQVFAQAMKVAADTVRAQDPGSLPSISGTQAPGPSNGVNWYLLDHIVDYLQPYSDDDQDELHRTMRPGLILTGFTGYGDHGAELTHQLWHRLLHGQTGASIFWQYTMLNADLTLTEQGRNLEAFKDEARNEGLALLLSGARRENCGIAVHYSLPSVRGEWITDGHIQPHEVVSADSTSAHLKRFHQDRHEWLQALEDAGYQYDFLTTEQIEAGGLFGYRVLILPDSIALTDREAAMIRQFVKAGGMLIADAETGLMNGHARWQTAGVLDDVLGVARQRIRSAPSEGSTTLKTDVQGDPLALDVIPSDTQLRPVATAEPHVEAGQASFLVENNYGAGRAVTLNFWMTDYARLRKSGKTGERLALLHKYLSQARVKPVAAVYTDTGKRLACSEVVAYWKQDAEFLAILPEPPRASCRDAGGFHLSFPEARYIYDLRAHKFLGDTDHVRGTLLGGEPVLYALETAPIPRLSITPQGRTRAALDVAPGDTVNFIIHWLGAGHAAKIDDAVHVEVRNPAGSVVDYYGANLPLGASPASFAIPLALNDSPGTWRVTAREAFTHQVATATFVVGSGSPHSRTARAP